MQEKQKKAIRWISPVLIALTALIVWRVNYEIEFMMDDEWYSTVLYADTPIRNLSDIIRAQIWHYFNWGGRSMAHALLQLILLAGEHWADILNTGMTLLLGWLACMIADRRKLPYWFAALGMILGLNANWKMDSTILCKSGRKNQMTVIWNRRLIKRPAPRNIRKAGKKRSTFSAPSERTDRRLEQ
jgi:hypothetical protein